MTNQQTKLTASQLEQLGSNYRFGLNGKEMDEDQAFKCFLKSANMGDNWGMNEAGRCYLNGEGVEKNYDKAIDLLKLAYERGDGDAEDKLKELSII